jgi:hypothetical protein
MCYVENVPPGFTSAWAVFRIKDRENEDENNVLCVEDALDVERKELTLKDMFKKYEGREDVVFVRVWVTKEVE